MGALYHKHGGKIKKNGKTNKTSIYKTLRLCVKNKNLPKVIDLTCRYFQNLRLVLDMTIPNKSTKSPHP